MTSSCEFPRLLFTVLFVLLIGQMTGNCVAGRELKDKETIAAELHSGVQKSLAAIPEKQLPGAHSDRIGERCTKQDIAVFQGASHPMPTGIPTYSVQIVNACASGCSISHIHVRCGWFSSARMVNPKLFRRLEFDDCLVNDGKPLKSGSAVTFVYANTFQYPISVSSIACR